MSINVFKRAYGKANSRNDEIEVLRTGEIPNARMSDIRRLVSGDHIIPYAHIEYPQRRVSLARVYSGPEASSAETEERKMEAQLYTARSSRNGA